MLATSSTLLAIVTVISSGFLILSPQFSFVTRAVIVIPLSGSGSLQRLPKVILSSFSPVLRLRSSPVTVTVISGSQCRFSRSCAQAFSSAAVSIVESVSGLHTVPQMFSFLLR